jgi:Arc/MetJ-type ribon-helix-helix transcriptional regulator
MYLKTLMAKRKIKTSATLSKETVDWIDQMIAKKRFASRTHAIEYAIAQLIEDEKKGK